MKFGVREICDVVFKSLQNGQIGSMPVVKGQPVLYIDSAKTSTIEGAATTVYATGGRGNARLIAWEGEKTLTFTVEDALLSEIGFAILSGAGLFDIGKDGGNGQAMVHCTEVIYGTETNLTYPVATSAPIFVMSYEKGSFGKKYNATVEDKKTGITVDTKGDTINVFFVDYYTAKEGTITELQIDAEKFAGYYYVEASTLFRREADGVDIPAEIVFPKVKIQSNFTFTMASTGDPSTFTFTMDAFPGYTMFEKTKKVLCAIQMIDDTDNKDNLAEVGPAVTTLDLVNDEKAELDGEGIKDSTVTA